MLPVCAALIAGPALAQTPPPAPVHDYAKPFYMSAADLAAKTAGGVTFEVPTAPGARLMRIRRDKDGEIEIHRDYADQIIVFSGHAKARIGGAVTGQRAIADGDWRGGVATGFQEYDVGPGDVLWVPAGMAHQFVVTPGAPFQYFTVKNRQTPGG
ncbi:MAG: hypothetical protein BGN86_01710 [Caulobacterales bacterium 68-7]|nr:MAG: hypothetical protein BGN86_01710 [Caulobacterales bacterium 68-7]